MTDMPNRMRCIYVAGAYSASNVIDVFANMRRGLHAGSLLIQAGFSPYVPWCDVLLHLQEGYSLEVAYRLSLAWMERSDGVVVVPERATDSHGTEMEVRRAHELLLPVFWEPTIEASIGKAKLYFRVS